MNKLLEEWGLQDLVPIFAENEIDIHNVIVLNDEQIKELIPKIGLRIKFMNKLNELKATNLNPMNINSMPMVFMNDGQSPSTSSSELAAEPVLNDSTCSQVFIVPTYRNETFGDIQDFLNQEKMPDFDLKTVLQMAPYGSLLLKYYKENEVLNDFMRNKLVDIIIRNVYQYVMKHNLTHQEYNLLASKIINCFPNECISKYYLSKKKMGAAVQARGKLVDKVKNLRYYSPDKVYQRKRKSASEAGDTTRSKQHKITEDDNHAFTWLKFNREPWEEVMRHWKDTFEIRRQYECNTVNEFVLNWPVIGDPRAESLIELDFSELYSGKELSLLKNWHNFFEKVLEHKKKDLKESKDPILTELLAHLKDEDLLEDSKVAIQLLTLVRIIPPKGRLTSSKGHWKFSTIEAVDALIIHCQNPGDIDVKVQNQIVKASKRKIKTEVQPYLVVQGEITDIRNVYIIIDKIHFKCVSTLKGLDLLFKLFFVLKIKYPSQVEYVWMLIQKAIFKIDHESDKVIPFIEDILNLFK